MEVEVFDRLYNYYRENKLSHAYLIETNNLDKCVEDLKTTIKKIFCNATFKENCSECNICNLIDQDFLPSLKIIEPKGSTIKKEDIIELKKTFSSVPVYTKDNIYIIKQAEKLNDSSANTMLKFLEEPEEHIIGFLITNNANSVIPTIKSRTELVNINYDSNENILEKNGDTAQLAVDYIKKIEVEKTNSIMYNKDVLFGKLTEREELVLFFKILLFFYKNALDMKLKNSPSYLEKYDLNFLSNCSFDNLVKKVNLISKMLKEINSNVNRDLLLDSFVIELGDING